ncbi:tRNA (adenosine(37)-N6)-threonylcarbamoyltransferase complex ATPase subunit type 1 TsaE [Nitrosophilus alvini]|uniref:tRNA (adenosine(37)-N6)-threonylcarbamoyltransferase complex ATPase subunit type 1 TsaE n=1 Tax=Nitrosophilus alvini TaxID=2714855 RepID=UPI00190A0FDE|nr:tRNA (adenosine(37)-N6)-threonylcarbamoyltransferase complex ATPase subunit type 1 TsaE [Nitrosophilus alvini]
METFESGLDSLTKVVDYLKELLKEGGVVILRGDLGSGKTTLVKEFAKSCGVENVTSPTFSIQQIYDKDIYHYDLYRTDLKKFMELGLLEELARPGIHFVEWGDEKLENFLKNAGFKTVVVEIEPKNEKRVYRVYNA